MKFICVPQKLTNLYFYNHLKFDIYLVSNNNYYNDMVFMNFDNVNDYYRSFDLILTIQWQANKKDINRDPSEWYGITINDLKLNMISNIKIFSKFFNKIIKLNYLNKAKYDQDLQPLDLINKLKIPICESVGKGFFKKLKLIEYRKIIKSPKEEYIYNCIS